MSLTADARVLLALARGQRRQATHAAALEAFYRPQAQRYDAFRERLLHGRRELIERLEVPAGGSVVELGAGTGRNLEFFGARLAGLARVTLVDLCPALLAVAARRCARYPNVELVEADASAWQPAQPADCVYLSYALTMIPDWRAALRGALAMLRPGGLLGVVDFYVSPRRPGPASVRHGPLTRWFWPRWFAHDGVRVSAAHLPWLRARLETIVVRECRAPMPYLPGLRAPYYLFIGRRPR